MEGRDAFESENGIAALRKVGNRLCRTFQTVRKDKCEIYYYYDIILDTLGRGGTNKILHDCNDHEVFV